MQTGGGLFLFLVRISLTNFLNVFILWIERPWPIWICKWLSTFFLDTERAPPWLWLNDQQWLGFSSFSCSHSAETKKTSKVLYDTESECYLWNVWFITYYNSNRGDCIQQSAKSEGDASDLQEWHKIGTCIVNTPRPVGYPMAMGKSSTTWVN